MTDTVTRTFFGIPVTGDVQGDETRAAQRPAEELAPILQAVINDPLIDSIGWDQYTPYFNDGDPCVFRVGTPWFRTTGDVDVDEEEYLVVDYGTHPTLGRREFTRQGKYPNVELIPGQYTGDHEALYDRARALNEALDSGAFDDALLAAFGDHAEITVRRDGIAIEFYEHD